MLERLKLGDRVQITKRIVPPSRRETQMESTLRMGGRLTIEKRRLWEAEPFDTSEIVLNTVNAEGKEDIIRQIAQIASGDFPIALDDEALITVEDTGDNPLVTRQQVDSAPTYGGAYFAVFVFTVVAGVGTGAWDDILIEAHDGASAYKEISEFLAQNSSWGTKASNEEWVVTYSLYVQ